MEDDESEEQGRSEPSIEHKLKRAREPLDHSPSSTACDPDHAAQDTTTTIQTGRHNYTENATFTKEDMPAQSDQWNTLNQANRDFYVENLGGDENKDGDEKNIRSEQHKQDDLNDLAAWGSQIGLSAHEIDRAATMVTAIEEPIKRRHGIEAVILAALTMAANEGVDVRHTEPKIIRPGSLFGDESTLSNDNSELDDSEREFPSMIEAYTKIRGDLRVEKKAVTKCRDHIRDNL